MGVEGSREMSDKNIYSEPKDFGFEMFDEINDDHASYSFDDFVIFKRILDGALFYAQDSGCSCPCPFENTTVGDLIAINDLKQLEIAIDEYRGDDPEYQRCTADRKQEVLRKVKDYLKGAAQ